MNSLLHRKSFGRRGEVGAMTMAVLFLFYLALIGVAILSGHFIFYGKGYDSRQVEAELLAMKVRSCIQEQTVIDKLFFEKLHERCALEKGVVEKFYNLRVCKNSAECISETQPLIGLGSKFQACRFDAATENESYPRCAFVRFKQGNDWFEIITISSQESRRNLG